MRSVSPDTQIPKLGNVGRGWDAHCAAKNAAGFAGLLPSSVVMFCAVNLVVDSFLGPLVYQPYEKRQADCC